MRLRPIAESLLVLLCLLCGQWAGAETAILIQESPLAGAQYHALPEVLAGLRVGDRLALVPEPGNRHDALAIRVEWQGHLLGYVPRRENRLLAEALARGARLRARVTALRTHPDPWQRVQFAVFAVL